MKVAKREPFAHRWWWLPTLYLVFLAYQSLIGSNIWNCKRELSAPFFRMYGASLSDFLANFVAYVPLGFLLAAPQMRRGLLVALVFASTLGFGFSLLMESIQLCLPGRVPSSFDLISNTLGTFAGAILAWFWHFWDEGRVRTVSDPQDLPLALKSVSLRALTLLAVLTWLAYQTKPWVFTVDVGQLRTNFSWLKTLGTYTWSWFGFARHVCAWLALLLAWRLSVSVHSNRYPRGSQTGRWLLWSLASLGLSVVVQAGLEARALGLEEFVGMAFALLSVGLISLALGNRKHVQSILSIWVIVFAYGTILAYQLEPGISTAPAFGHVTKTFSLLPTLGTQQLVHAIDYALFFAWFGVMLAVAACARSSSSTSFQKLSAAAMGKTDPSAGAVVFALGWKLPLVAALAVAATELAQYWIPGRGVDSSPVLFTVLGYLFANRLISRAKPII